MTQPPLLLDNDAVRRLLSLDALLPAIEQALIELSAGRVTQPLRTVFELKEPGSLLFVKPALVGDALATKLITQVPGNPARGLPTMIATLLLLDPASGQPLAVMDATWLTELRTAAVSAVAYRMGGESRSAAKSGRCTTSNRVTVVTNCFMTNGSDTRVGRVNQA